MVRGQAALDFAHGDGEDVQSLATLGLVGLLDRLDNLRSHIHAEVRSDEGGFQIFKGVGVEPGGAGDDAFDFVRQLAMRFLQAGLELLEEAHGVSGKC
jgi:hypothetical protein